MILELDAGNTRIKWRLAESGAQGVDIVAQGSVLAQEKTPSVFIELGQQIDTLPISSITRVKVANVRGDGFRDAFSAIMTERWRLQPEYAVVEKHCAGVTNSYGDPSSMGVDRWLAMLAAYRATGGPCCIVDAGTAIKIDLLDAGGRHLGGYIVPGIGTMRDSLAQRSRRLRLEEDPRWEAQEPGKSTREAVEHGILSTALALLEHVRREYAGAAFDWFLSGGDGEVLARHVDWKHRLAPDLVLDGLSLSLS